MIEFVDVCLNRDLATRVGAALTVSTVPASPRDAFATDAEHLTESTPAPPPTCTVGAAETAPIFSDATFSVVAGQITLLAAPVHAALNRVFAALLGEAPIAHGSLRLCQANPQTLRRSALRHLRRRVGILPADLHLLPDASALFNAALPLEMDGVPRVVAHGRAMALLTELGVAQGANVRTAQLPLWAQQRVALARAFVRQPDVLLIDEPGLYQDATGTTVVCEALQRAASRGAAVLVVSSQPRVTRYATAHGWTQYGLYEGQLQPVLDEETFEAHAWASAPQQVAAAAPGTRLPTEDAFVRPNANLQRRVAAGTDAPPASARPVSGAHASVSLDAVAIEELLISAESAPLTTAEARAPRVAPEPNVATSVVVP